MSALKFWSEGVDTAAIAGLSPERKRELIDDITQSSSRGENPVLLDGLVNVWCVSALTSGGVATINIVATNSQKPNLSKTGKGG